MRFLITGGAGFIGSNFVRHILNKYPDYWITNLDKLTYAGNLDNIKDLQNNPRHSFARGDICNKKLVNKLASESDVIINFAAETHVDRSIQDPESFIKTDIIGTHTLLEAAKKHKIKRYIQISTDEVYGSIDKGSFNEKSTLKPSSQYSASKAGGDLLANSYFVTHKVPVIITRTSNNFGPYQYPEKLIPLFITNALENKPLPLYGSGKNIRDWIYVEDNCRAIDAVLHNGKDGEIYNIGAGNEITNIEITRFILKYLKKSTNLIKKVPDRPGHDKRYSINCSKLKTNLKWKPETDFQTAMKNTIDWYVKNRQWWKKLKNKEYKKYYKNQYKI
jgi:dTDP-glucose 4,6-dehydratase